jgi:hypothetical protein
MFTLSIEAVVQAVFVLIILGLVFWLLWWLIGYCGIPEPFNKVARVLLAVLAAFILIGFLLGLIGHPIVTIH